MNKSEKYFIQNIEQDQIVQGACNDFITQQELNWRTVEKLQQYPLVPVAKYYRNIQYKAQNTRKVDCLQQNLEYLCAKVLSKILQKDCNELNIASFMQQRVKAIRCEYFIQRIIYPKQLIKIIRLNFMFTSLLEQPLNCLGLDILLNTSYQQTMIKDYCKQYKQALAYGLLCTQKIQLHQFLQENPIIFEDQYLKHILSIRKKILNGNYRAYFDALNKENSIIKCILWAQITQQRILLCDKLKKCKMKVKKSWLFRLLGLRNEEGWINLSEGQNYKDKDIARIGIKLWLNFSTLYNDVIKQ